MENIYIADLNDPMFDFVLEYDHKEFMAEIREESKLNLTPELHPFYGKKHTEEFRAKMSAKMSARAKIFANTELGKKQRSETAKKRKGELNGFYGKTHSEESRVKMSDKARINSNTDLGKKQRSENGKKVKGKKWWNNGTSHKRSERCPGREWVAGRINLTGTPHTQKAKEKMSKIRKEYWKQKKGA